METSPHLRILTCTTQSKYYYGPSSDVSSSRHLTNGESLVFRLTTNIYAWLSTPLKKF